MSKRVPRAPELPRRVDVLAARGPRHGERAGHEGEALRPAAAPREERQRAARERRGAAPLRGGARDAAVPHPVDTDAHRPVREGARPLRAAGAAAGAGRRRKARAPRRRAAARGCPASPPARAGARVCAPAAIFSVPQSDESLRALVPQYHESLRARAPAAANLVDREIRKSFSYHTTEMKERHV